VSKKSGRGSISSSITVALVVSALVIAPISATPLKSFGVDSQISEVFVRKGKCYPDRGAYAKYIKLARKARSNYYFYKKKLAVDRPLMAQAEADGDISALVRTTQQVNVDLAFISTANEDFKTYNSFARQVGCLKHGPLSL